MTDNRFLIITGLSGSGKTVVSRFLEDLGYYCIDNLPSKLLVDFVNLWQRREVEIDRVALVVDIRETGFYVKFPKAFKAIKKKISPRLIFLEAKEEILIQRFSETRRTHPLAEGCSVREALAMERTRLAEIRELADDVVDTSATSIAGLKKIFTSRLLGEKIQRLQTTVITFGYKHGLPLDSDLVFDLRFLPNPFYIDTLRNKTGRSKPVSDYVLSSPETKKFMKKLFDFFDFLMPRFIEEGKSYLTIALGCTGGKHRSVALGEEVKRHFEASGFEVRIHHRDIYK